MVEKIRIFSNGWKFSVNVNGVINTYIATLLTNVIVFMGIISLVEWLKSHDENPKNRLWAYLLTVFFLLYSFVESVLHSAFGPDAFGNHWTFANLIIILMIYMNLNKGFRLLEYITTAVGLLLFVFINYTDLELPEILLTLAIIVGFYIMNRNANRILHLQVLQYGLYLFFGALCLILRARIHPDLLDHWFWFRQIFAYVFIATIACVYTYLLRKNYQLRKDYQLRSNVDELTHLGNVRQFNNTIETVFKRIKSGEETLPYSIYMLDVDYFKQVNDTYGHLAGNVVLQKVADILASYVATLEVEISVYRVGGEEFTILVHHVVADPAKSEIFARAILTKIQDASYEYEGQQIHITGSLGQTMYHPDDRNYLDAYQRADKAMYQSKKAGRNAFTTFDKTVSLPITFKKLT